LGGKLASFGGEASSLPPPVDETLVAKWMHTMTGMAPKKFMKCMLVNSLSTMA